MLYKQHSGFYISEICIISAPGRLLFEDEVNVAEKAPVDEEQTEEKDN